MSEKEFSGAGGDIGMSEKGASGFGTRNVGENSPDISPEFYDIQKYKGTEADQRHMERMGKKQVLRRNFGFFSIFGFTMILLSTWEIQIALLFATMSLTGTAGLIYLYLGVFVCMIAIILCMAEMASIAPTAGGQYHWVSEFSPPQYQQFLSYIVGWLSVLGWQSGSASSGFLAGSQLQGLIILNTRAKFEGDVASYTPEAWHASLMVIAVIFFCAVFNTFLAHKLPLVEGGILILHIFGFFAIMIPLLVMGPRNSAKNVFTDFRGAEIWGNQGLSILAAMFAPVVSMLGADCATHMAEELEDAGRVLPRAMWLTAVVNGLMGFGMLLVVSFRLGDYDLVAASDTGFPHLEIFYQATGSYAGATVMGCILLILAFFACISNVATASRQLFAFARDGAVPFSTWFAAVPKGQDIPLNAIIFTTVVSSCLALINIGSSIAYNVITSIGVNGLLTSYIVSIACILIKRWNGEALPPRSFSLGKLGIPINIFSLLFLVIAYIFNFFPAVPNPSPADMNWASLVYGVVVIFAIVYFYTHGRKTYAGPVTKVKMT